MPKEDVEPSFPALNFVEGLELYDPKVRVYYKDQKTGKAVRLGDVLNYRALYKKFPDFGDIPVVFINERINDILDHQFYHRWAFLEVVLKINSRRYLYME